MNQPRFETRVPGLDQILGGGLLETGLYMVQGTPGAGKTILANQICFTELARGGKVVYVTMLAESHARLLSHMSTMSFYRADAVTNGITYVSAFDALRTEGLPGVVRLLQLEMRRTRATLLVVDGLVGLPSHTVDETHATRVFVSELQAHATLHGCTTLLLSSIADSDQITAEQTIVDGLILMRKSAYGARRERSIEITKSRGIAAMSGRHALQIGDDGITIHPRLEARHEEPPEHEEAAGTTVPSGIGGLDALIEPPGLPASTITVLTGYPGTGKTTFGLNFLAAAAEAEPALHFGFFESPGRLIGAAERAGLPLRARQAAGRLRFVWTPYGQGGLDELGYRLLDAVETMGAKRVFVDGLGGFIATPTYDDRGPAFFSALARQLRAMGATTIFTSGSPDREGRGFTRPNEPILSLADNLMTIRMDTTEGRVRRSLSIEKLFDARYDTHVHELTLDARGLRLVRA